MVSKFNRNFTLVLIGQIISLFGSAIQRFSLSLYLLELTGSPAIYGNILALSILPYIFCAPIAGELADQVSKKKIMIYLDFACFGVLLVYGVYLQNDGSSPIIAGAVMIALSVAAALYAPAVTASLPQIMRAEQLKFANSCVSQVGAWANILGPVVAGILYGFFGITTIVFLNAISFCLSAIMECFLQIPFERTEKRQRLSLNIAYQEMGKTANLIRKEYQVVFFIILSYGLYNVCIVPINTIILPYVMNLLFRVPSEVYGTVEGMIVIGSLASGLLLAVKPTWFPFHSAYLWNYPMSFALIGMVVSVLFFAESEMGVLLFTISGMIIMFCLGVGNIVTLTYMQEKIPNQMLGKVSALSTAVATATVPIGQVLLGNLLEISHVGVVLILAVVFNSFVSLFVRWNIKNELLRK